MNDMILNLFKRIDLARPTKTQVLTADDFVAMVRRWVHTPLAAKKDGQAFSLCKYREGGGRKETDIEYMCAIVLDIDRGVTPEQLEFLAEQLAGKAHVIYSTYSSEPGKFKLRVIFPLAEPISPEDYKKQKLPLRAAKLIDIPIDPASLNVTQLYFMPICPPGCEDDHHIHVGEGVERWSVGDLPALEVGDEKRYLDKSAKSLRASKDTKQAQSKQEVFEKIDQLVANHFGGVPPIYCEYLFHLYEAGCWWPFETKMLIKALMTEVFGESVGLDELGVLIEYMKVRYLEPTFPEALGDDDEPPPPLICLTNGTIDPFSGEMVSSSPKHFLRSQMGYAFEPDATCELWLKYLSEVFQQDQDRDQKIAFLQEFMGYLLIPSTRFQVMLWLHGQGDNGKSVILDVLAFLLGEKNVAAIPLERLSKRFQSAELAGKLVNLVHELAADSSLRDDVLKQAVSGNPIQGERKNKDPFVFRPFARFVVAMNHLPRVKDTSHGFFRRVRLLTFNRIFKREEQDRDLVQKLKAELPGIFVWALAGLQRLWAQGDFTIVPSSVNAIDQYKKECNPVALFVNDLVIPASSGTPAQELGSRSTVKTLIHDVFRTYQAYCRAKGFHPLSDARFGREMSGLGYAAVKSSGKRYYQLTLRKPEDVGINGMFAPQVTQFTQLEDAFDRDDPEPMPA